MIFSRTSRTSNLVTSDYRALAGLADTNVSDHPEEAIVQTSRRFLNRLRQDYPPEAMREATDKAIAELQEYRRQLDQRPHS